MASKQTRKATFDAQPPLSVKHKGGWYVFSNIEQQTVTDMDGTERTVWVAEATWQDEKPEFVD